MTNKDIQIAGWIGVGAGFAWVGWIGLNLATHGGLDVGAPAISERLIRVGGLLMGAQNLLTVPAVLVLRAWLRGPARERVDWWAICGLISLSFWAYASASGTNSLGLEATYLALSAVWWLGIGQAILPRRRALGAFTIVLGGFALLDSIFSAVGGVPFWLYLTAAPKVPLSVIWVFWAAGMLVRLGRQGIPDDAAAELAVAPEPAEPMFRC